MTTRCSSPAAVLLLLLLSFATLLSPSSVSAGISPQSWSQQGGDSANSGFGANATFNATNVSIFSHALNNQQCEQSFVYSARVNSFWIACWNYDPSSNNNVTLWQINASDGQVQFAQSVTAYAQSAAGPQLATPALYEGDGVIVFLQTNIELWSFVVDLSTGVIGSSSKVDITGTVLCGMSLTVSQSQSLLLLQTNADVVAYKITAAGASDVAWTYSYPNPSIGYLLSAVAEDVDSQLFIYTFSREYWGSDVVALDTAGNLKWHAFYPVTNVISIASTPLIVQQRSYVSLYPYGQVVIENESGTVLTNGSYALTQAAGLSPNLWFNSVTGQSQILYECQSNDGERRFSIPR